MGSVKVEVEGAFSYIFLHIWVWEVAGSLLAPFTGTPISFTGTLHYGIQSAVAHSTHAGVELDVFMIADC
jgi:hypothetical protein